MATAATSESTAEGVKTISSEPKPLVDTVMEYLATSGIDLLKSLIAALVIIFVGWLIGRWIGKVVSRWLHKIDLEPPVKILIVRVVRMLIFVLTLVIAAQKMGVPIVPLLTGAGVIGLGVGLAMQGVLSNVVAGLSIIFTKPYRVGQYIEILGEEGRVESIELFTTILSHADKSLIVIPNRKIVGEILHNYGSIRQLTLTVGVSYGTDLNRAFAVIKEVLDQNPRVLKEPVPVLGVTTLADSSVNITVAPWVQVPDYGAAKIELYRAMLENLRQAKVEIPFPQREVRLLNEVS